MKFCFVLFIFTIISFSNSEAIDWQKCSINVASRGNGIGLTVSTSSYLSSIGDCAMIGVAEHDKKIFIAQNLDQLKVDSARGQGEYLDAYASLSGCSKYATQKLGIAIQRNFTSVYGSKLEYTAEKSYGQIEELISKDPKLSKSCKPRV